MRSYIVDSFTNEPFKGNPAGVCFPGWDLPKEKMLQIAQEFGLSETAFIWATDKKDIFDIRYFSPKQEMPLCGHATLASAKVIFNDTGSDNVLFITGENVELKMRRQKDEVIMEFPVYDTSDTNIPYAILEALGLSEVLHASYNANYKIIILEINDPRKLADLRPDFNALIRSYQNIDGVLVTAPSHNKEYDFHYRYFWPWSGTNEDPVTGGVQTFLARYWSKRLNKMKMKAFQSSGRTGYMTVELLDNKVFIYGNARIVLEGNLMIQAL